MSIDGRHLSLHPSQVSLQINRDAKNVSKGIRKAAHFTAEIARNILSMTAPVGDGLLKASLRVNRQPTGEQLASVHADAPYAGIIERGARPHPVSRDGRHSIARWAKKKFGLTDKEAEGVAFAISLRIAGKVRGRKGGQEPRWWFKNNLPGLEKILQQEVARLTGRSVGQK